MFSIFRYQALKMLDTRPNHTIYINNLNEKIKKDGKFLIKNNVVS